MKSVITAIQKLTQAEKWLSEAKGLDDLKQIHDIAVAAEAYAQAHRLGIQAENHAVEVRLLAARRIGELVPAEQGKRIDKELVRTSDKLSIPKQRLSEFRRLAEIPIDEFLQYVEGFKKRQEKISYSKMLRIADVPKEYNLSSPDTCAVCDLVGLVNAGKKFRTIYADPPWKYSNQATRAATDNHYQTLSPEEIARLPIQKLAEPEAHLHLWTTNAFLFESKAIMEAWGFEYKSCFIWVKPQMGIGNYWRVSHEFLLLGVRGGLRFMDNAQMSWKAIERREHSEKPDEIRQIIEKVSQPQRLELFARKLFDGWVVWGNEIERSLFNQQYL